MTDTIRAEFHELFYNRVVGYFKKLKRDGRELYSTPCVITDKRSIYIEKAFEERNEEIRYNYQRDRWLEKRKKLLMITSEKLGGGWSVLAQYDKSSGTLTVYKHALRKLGEDETIATEELLELCEKFFILRVEDKYPSRYVDISSSRNSNIMEVT